MGNMFRYNTFTSNGRFLYGQLWLGVEKNSCLVVVQKTSQIAELEVYCSQSIAKCMKTLKVLSPVAAASYRTNIGRPVGRRASALFENQKKQSLRTGSNS